MVKLEQAQKLVDEVIAELNTKEHICPHCGVKAKENWTQHQAAQELEAVSKKLEKWIHRLRR